VAGAEFRFNLLPEFQTPASILSLFSKITQQLFRKNPFTLLGRRLPFNARVEKVGAQTTPIFLTTLPLSLYHHPGFIFSQRF
jgi:hypothetical protein